MPAPMTEIQALKEAELVLGLKASKAKRADAAAYWLEARDAVQKMRLRLQGVDPLRHLND